MLHRACLPESSAARRTRTRPYRREGLATSPHPTRGSSAASHAHRPCSSRTKPTSPRQRGRFIAERDLIGDVVVVRAPRSGTVPYSEATSNRFGLALVRTFRKAPCRDHRRSAPRGRRGRHDRAPRDRPWLYAGARVSCRHGRHRPRHRRRRRGHRRRRRGRHVGDGHPPADPALGALVGCDPARISDARARRRTSGARNRAPLAADARDEGEA